MSLSQFYLVVTIDKNDGISKQGIIPWNTKSNIQYTKELTTGTGRNIVIFGRKTYDLIPDGFKPPENRKTIVVSRSWEQHDHPEILVAEDFGRALSISASSANFNDVFVCGGESIFNLAITKYLYLCKGIICTKYKKDGSPDQFFNFDLVKNFEMFKDKQMTRDFTRFFLKPNVSHGEYEYTSLLKKIMEEGEEKTDRTGTGTKSLFSEKLEFDLSDGAVPVITTKKVNYKIVLKELLFFISGKTDTKILEEQGVKIWKHNTSREFLDSVDLDEYAEGDMGPTYGYQWRHWGLNYSGSTNEKGENGHHEGGIDQLFRVIESIKNDPHGRRHIVNSWNVNQIDDCPLPPCHILFQFNVSGCGKYLDCQMYQRSADMFLGVPFNILSYSLLTRMVAHITNLKARKFSLVIGDAHIYNNHTLQCTKQIKRVPYPFPTLKFRHPQKLKNFDDFTENSFVIEDYISHPQINGEIS